jgi:beta-lactamase regulating signal transducer with metallopeptidase domain
MINILLNASITGGIVVLLCCLLYPLSQRYFKASWHYAILKTALLFLVIPVSLFVPVFGDIYTGWSAKPEAVHISAISGQIQRVSIDAETINSALSDIVFSDFLYPPLPVWASEMNNMDDITYRGADAAGFSAPYLQILWCAAAAIMFLCGLFKMRRFRKQILSASTGDVDRKTVKLFMKCKKRLAVRGNVSLRTSKHISHPLVFGLVRPFVIFPETGMSGNEKRLALTHELTHIKNGDLWVKFFAFVAASVHWFNPLAHLLRFRLSVLSEEYCDECVVKKMTKKEGHSYGKLILKSVSGEPAPPAKFCSALSAPAKIIKNRLSNIVNLKKSRKGTVFSVVSAVMILMLTLMFTAL